MSSKEYYDNTENKEPTKLLKYFVNKISNNPGNAIELGCGAGVDTVFLIKNGWNVLAIDASDTKQELSTNYLKKNWKDLCFCNKLLKT